ncbi:unnamed protein product [Cylicocyclus nassatus]|uniref:Uncharacterized protein n=1 Tax=Cylicocyclus nassatus TaxID=53992 RepID=A0AA36H2V9_CYLNA|nr:unnamed protein product [Cylicocyclus nassatus]
MKARTPIPESRKDTVFAFADFVIVTAFWKQHPAFDWKRIISFRSFYTSFVRFQTISSAGNKNTERGGWSIARITEGSVAAPKLCLNVQPCASGGSD